MFNFFDSLKKENSEIKDCLTGYNMVFMGSCLLYVEGHKGILKLEEDVIVFKVKKGVVTVKGEGLFLKDLKKDTLTIKGNIKNVETL